MGHSLPGSSVHGDSPGKNNGVGCHALLQGIFLTQGLNPCLYSPSLAGRFFTTSTTWEAHLSFKPLFITFLCYAVFFLLFVDIRFKIYTDGMFTYISGTEASRAFRLLLNYRFLGFIPCQYPVLTKLESLEPGLRNVYFK